MSGEQVVVAERAESIRAKLRVAAWCEKKSIEKRAQEKLDELKGQLDRLIESEDFELVQRINSVELISEDYFNIRKY